MTWKCESGCDGLCEHLEELLPKMSGQSIHAYPRSDLIDRKTKDIFDPKKGEEDRLSSILENAHITPFDREIIALRLLDGKSFKDIAAHIGFTSEDTASYYFRKIKRLLKERLDKEELHENISDGH